MESLIPTINKLQDVFATIGDKSIISLPEIVVVGSQSAGKSSVMEGLVGKDFLPRGSGVVTRRPLFIRLIHTPLDDPKRKKEYGCEDWAYFEHKPNEIFTDFQKVRMEIEEETDREAGKNKGISNVPISLNIYSARVVNLSLTDLPGITKNPVGDQPRDIEKQIRNMILPIIQNPNSLILAVTPANQDFATSESLSLAREVDPNGERTLCVLTKLDIMDAGTDATEVLTGNIIPVKLGIIGVVNRSQADINDKKSVKDCLLAESLYLQNKYPQLADEHGIPYLAETLSKLLNKHIHKCLPNLKETVAKLVTRNQDTLATLGEPVTDKNSTILQIISRFSKSYTSALDGISKDLESNELSCGARICYVFHDIFSKEIDEINPTQNLHEKEILTAIRNAAGARPALFVPENSFDFLVTKQLGRLEKPSLRCVDLIYEELLRVVHHCGFEIREDRKRFPSLYEHIDDILLRFLEPRVVETKKFVEQVVQVQLAYINTKHPEFADTKLAEIFEELGKDVDEKNKYAHTAHFPRATTSILNATPLTDPNNVVKSFGSQLLTFQTTQSVANSFLLRGNVGEETTKKIEQGTLEKLTEREERDQKLIKELIAGYFSIIQKSVKDIVPKAIMNGIVNEVRENFRDELVKILHKSNKIEELLTESATTNERRKRVSQTLDALNKADQILNKIRDNRA